MKGALPAAGFRVASSSDLNGLFYRRRQQVR
jgi:hypothetical protein